MLETLPVRFRSEGKLLELLDQLDEDGYFLVLDGVTDPREFRSVFKKRRQFRFAWRDSAQRSFSASLACRY